MEECKMCKIFYHQGKYIHIQQVNSIKTEGKRNNCSKATIPQLYQNKKAVARILQGVPLRLKYKQFAATILQAPNFIEMCYMNGLGAEAWRANTCIKSRDPAKFATAFLFLSNNLYKLLKFDDFIM